MKPLLKALPCKPYQWAPHLLDPEDTGSNLYRLMELGAQRDYIGRAAGRAKWEERYHKQGQVQGEVKLLPFSPDVAIICFPANVCVAATATIKERSPFSLTLVWSDMAPRKFGHLIPESEGMLGGPHYGGCDYAQEAIDAMMDSIVQQLQTIHNQLRER